MSEGVFKINYRQRQAQNTRRHILAVAVDLFKRDGYDNVSVEDIVRTAQLSRGSFYVHYKNKEDLLAEYMRAVEGKYLEFYSSQLSTDEYAECDAIDRIGVFLKFTTKTLAQNGQALLRVYYSYLLRVTDVWATRDRNFFAVMHLLVSDARRDQLLPEDLSDEELINLSTYVIRGITMEWSVAAEFSPIEERDHMVDAFCLRLRRPS